MGIYTVSRLRNIAALFFCSAMLCSADAIADVAVTIWRDKTIDVEVTGNITPSDYPALIEKIANAKSRSRHRGGLIWAKLNSPGGDVETALKIGRLFRKEEAVAQIHKEAVCASSCVFILAGAVGRVVEGSVGIHRPFNPTSTDSSASAQKDKYRKLGAAIKGDLAEMNIPARLYDDMLYIGPDRIRVLNDTELRDYGLSGNDPYWEEAADVKRAQILGVTRDEYARRAARARTVCGTFSEHLSRDEAHAIARCKDDVEHGKR